MEATIRKKMYINIVIAVAYINPKAKKVEKGLPIFGLLFLIVAGANNKSYGKALDDALMKVVLKSKSSNHRKAWFWIQTPFKGHSNAFQFQKDFVAR